MHAFERCCPGVWPLVSPNLGSEGLLSGTLAVPGTQRPGAVRNRAGRLASADVGEAPGAETECSCSLTPRTGHSCRTGEVLVSLPCRHQQSVKHDERQQGYVPSERTRENLREKHLSDRKASNLPAKELKVMFRRTVKWTEQMK